MPRTPADERKILHFIVPDMGPCCGLNISQNITNAFMSSENTIQPSLSGDYVLSDGESGVDENKKMEGMRENLNVTKFKKGLLYSVMVDALAKTVAVEVDKIISAEEVLKVIYDSGFERAYSIPEDGYEEIYFSVVGLTSAFDANIAQKKLEKLVYLSGCKINYGTSTLTITIPAIKEDEQSLPEATPQVLTPELTAPGQNSGKTLWHKLLPLKLQPILLPWLLRTFKKDKVDVLDERTKQAAKKTQNSARLEYISTIVEGMETALNKERDLQSRLSLTLINSPVQAPPVENPKDFINRGLINAAIFFPLWFFSHFIPAPINLLGQLIGIGLSGITLTAMWQSGKKYYEHAWNDFKTRSFTMNTLIAIGTACAWLYSLWLIFFPTLAPGIEYQFQLATANMVLFFVNCGQAAKSWATQRAEQEVKNLNQVFVDSQPQIAKRLKVPENKKVGLRSSAEDELNETQMLEQIFSTAEIESIPYLQIRQGDYLLVPADTRVPVEGTILNDVRVFAHQGTLTGESKPCEKKKGSEVYSGSLVTGGDIYIQAKHNGEEARLHKVVQDAAKARQASHKKPIISPTIDKIAKVFTPTIMFIATSASLFWLAKGSGLAWSANIFMSVLLCACPCAFSLATPITVALCLYKLFNQRVLVHEPSVLEIARHIDTIVFDKTGTLTTPEVAKIFVPKSLSKQGITQQKILQYAASLEQSPELCEHPIAQAFLAVVPNTELIECKDGKKTGTGVSGTLKLPRKDVEQKDPIVHVGTREYMRSKGIVINDADFMVEVVQPKKNGIPSTKKAMSNKEAPKVHCENSFKEEGLTTHYIAVNRECCGIVGLRHTLREDAKEAIRAIRELRKGDLKLDLYILTGDKTEAAQSVAKELGITKVFAEKTEDEKRIFIKTLKGETEDESLTKTIGLRNSYEGIKASGSRDKALPSIYAGKQERFGLSSTDSLPGIKASGSRDKALPSIYAGKQERFGLSSTDSLPPVALSKMEKVFKTAAKWPVLGGLVEKIADMLGVKIHAKRRRCVLMVGDGINDMKAISDAADIGVALGSWAKVSPSAHVAIQNLRSLASFLIITRETTVNIYQNLAISAFYNLFSIATAVGILYPYGLIFAPHLASLAMAIPSLLVILNAVSLTLQIKYALKTFNADNEGIKETEKWEEERRKGFAGPANKLPSKPGLFEQIAHTFPLRILTALVVNIISLTKSAEGTMKSDFEEQKAYKPVEEARAKRLSQGKKRRRKNQKHRAAANPAFSPMLTRQRRNSPVQLQPKPGELPLDGRIDGRKKEIPPLTNKARTKKSLLA